MTSCLYRGWIRHRRLTPVPHDFRYGLFMVYLDLGELPGALEGGWLWSARRPALAWFRRADYLGDPAIPLDQAVRELVAARTGRAPTGPIRLLTHLRYFGYIQNPVSFYYCFDAAGLRLEFLVAEVTNTPWGERHAYVMPITADGPRYTARTDKALHVSPFMPMDQQYDWGFTAPDRRLAVHMASLENGIRVFDATLALRREPLSGRALARALAHFPWMTAQVVARIYWQAARLRLKRAPFHAHPHSGQANAPAALDR